MRKIPRRLFLLALLAACSPIRSDTQSSPTLAPPTFPPLPTIFPFPTIAVLPYMAPTPNTDLAMEEATTVPINVVIPVTDGNCLAPVVAPAEPAVIPAVGGIDATTGRHMMGIPQVIDHQGYRLKVSGLVDHPLSLSYDELRCMPKITETVTTRCYNFADTATWSGVLLSEVLKKAGVKAGAKKMTQYAADTANRTVTMEMAMDGHNFLAYEMDGKPLPVLFGFPLRTIFIDVAGQYSVKWLTELEII